MLMVWRGGGCAAGREGEGVGQGEGEGVGEGEGTGRDEPTRKLY